MTYGSLGKLGLTNTHPFYRAWAKMKERCNNPNVPAYKYYGNEGVGYDPRWEIFENFYLDMWSGWEPGLTLERIKRDKPYSKENCKWATWTEQARNKRNNKFDEETVRCVRAMYASGEFTQWELARKFGTTQTSIHNIVRNKVWNL